MSHQKPNARGFSHHLLLPLLAVLIVGSIGSYVMLRSSSAASTTHYCSEKTFGRYKNNPVYAKYDNMKICVQRIQKKVGVSNQDGYYGDYTQKKVKAWQTKYNKTQTNPKKRLVVDGVVGGATWGAMKITQKYPSATARSCKAKGSKYEWKSNKCQKKQTATTTSSNKSTGVKFGKVSCASGYVNKASDGTKCVKVGGDCTKVPYKNKGTWQKDGTCKIP